jgi:hypothetical protein
MAGAHVEAGTGKEGQGGAGRRVKTGRLCTCRRSCGRAQRAWSEAWRWAARLAARPKDIKALQPQETRAQEAVRGAYGLVRSWAREPRALGLARAATGMSGPGRI